MNILAIDPGGTTGIAAKTTMATVMTFALTEPEQLWETVTKSAAWDYVIIERFAAVTISKHGLATTELVGGVRALCWHKGIQFVYRSPQHRKAFQKQAHEFLAHKKHVIHEADALAHLFAWEAHLADNGSSANTK